MDELLERVRQAERISEDAPDEAARVCVDVLNEDPDNALALFLFGTLYARAENYGMAYNVMKRVTELAPHRDQAWNNLGMALEGLGQHEAARKAFVKAWNQNERNPGYAANVAMTFGSERNHELAKKWAHKALTLDPGHAGAQSALGFAALATGDWTTGWPAYGYALGGKYRKEIVYGDEPRWDGSPGKHVVVYGEQGLGDEIMGASCVPDLMRDASSVIVDCDSRLEGLFKRSFPGAFVHGTRRADEVDWLDQYKIDARCPLMGLPEFYRPTPASCPGAPYLVADPERRLQWRALFDSWGKRPKIGLCWSGGTKATQATDRDMGWQAFKPLMDAIDADWISLQYKPCDAGPIRVFERATLTADYDDTAGLVAELDAVVGVHTAVHHLAGALGVPGIILVPPNPCWTYALDPFPWYASARLFRQRKAEAWIDTVRRLAHDPECLGRLRPA